MTEDLILAAEAETEFTEKRSRFIGHVWPVESEEQARACIEQTRKQHYDARHNCWCYRISGGPTRYSDDGEPQGTAGQPMLNVFERAGVQNVCCVVTRYFGGILLGAGGLVRAYTKSAKDAMERGGIARRCVWDCIELPCPYPLFERVKLEIAKAGGEITATEYADNIRVLAALPQPETSTLAARLTELSSGALVLTVAGNTYRADLVEK